ncbi:MAG: DUF2927 domain-containing protein [Pseudomonadota bacterium]
MRAAFAAAGLALALAACAPASGPERGVRTVAASPGPLPSYDGYGAAVGAQEIPWTRRTLADDFIELTFDTEWGLRANRLLKWDRPVRVSLMGTELRGYRGYAEGLVRRLDAATGDGLAITLVEDVADAEIVFRTAPRAAMKAFAPEALCFFQPFSGDWGAFIASREGAGDPWADLDRLKAITVFIPAAAAPHEIRACLEEEAAQALGAYNDLFRFEDSIFNDDAAHLRLTAFDALMLRVLYDPAIQPGMGREETREAARAALGRAHGAFGAARRFARIGDDVHDDLLARVRAARSRSESRRWADRLVGEMETRERPDHRLAEALVLRAQLAFRDNEAAAALADVQRAETILARDLPADNIRLAIVRATAATLLQREGRARDALARLDLSIPVLAANAYDRHLALALRWRTASLSQTGDKAAAAPAAREALEWARYVYGRDSEEVRLWSRQFRDMGLLGRT